MSKCTINEDETSGTCPAFLEYIILLEEEEHSTWVYSEYHITQAGYTYLENDFDVMNFSKLGSYNTVYAYSTFTMPEHDVYFCPDYPV